MSPRSWVYLVAASGHLTLAVLSVVRGRRSPISRPLALLCFDMFGFCLASLANSVTGAEAWGVLDAIFTALAPPLALHLVMTFVGARRAHVRALATAYVVFGGLALSSAAGCLVPGGRAWHSSSAWYAVFLAAWTPTLVSIVALLVVHLVAAGDPDEKARTRTMLAALALGGTLATSDILGDLGLPLPHAAPLGTLGGTFLVATAAFRFRLFDRDLSVSTAIYAGALALSGVVATIALFNGLGGHLAALCLGTATVAGVLAIAVRELALSLVVQRERRQQLLVLGRFSSQMAHDIKNPLASIKGALQFLREERAQGKSLDDSHEFIDLMLEEVERLHRVVDGYQRIGRVQAVRRALDVNAVVRSVVALEPFAAHEGTVIRAELAEELPSCELDGDLLCGALQNVILNAFEAMPHGGALTVRTEAAEGGVVISVEDQGEGMDSRHAERAFDDFYTTKPQGSGLGLAFVRRVALAHGGDVSLQSRVGVGTIVRLRLSAG